MSDRITLPGTPKGLLRRGSPAVVKAVPEHPAVVVQLTTTHAVVSFADTCDDDGPSWGELPLALLALDLTDPTGQVHAAWWAMKQPGHESLSVWEVDVLDWALHGRADPTALRDLCMKLAGAT